MARVSRLGILRDYPQVMMATSGYTMDTTYPIPGKDGKQRTQVTHGVRFNMPGYAGCCGSPYVSNTEATDEGLQYIHVAGGLNTSVATALCREDYDRFYKEVTQERMQCEVVDPVLNFGRCSSNIRHLVEASPIPGYTLIGEIDKKSSQPIYSEFEKSILWDEPLKYENKFLPAILKDDDGSLAKTALRNKSRLEPGVIPEMLNPRAFDGVFTDAIPHSFQKITLKEAIKGTLESRALAKDTASGPPITVCNIKKEQVVDFEEGDLKDEFKVRFEEMENNFSKGIYERQLADGCFKDEMRGKEKVEQRKTRMFFIMPLLFNLFTKLYFTVMFEGMQTDANGDIGVGFNPFSIEWNMLYAYLREKGSFADFSDATGWDLVMMGCFADILANHMSYWYSLTDRQFKIVRGILLMALYPYITVKIGKRFVVLSGTQMPSGWYGTLMINSMYHSWKRRVIWLYYCKLVDRDILFHHFNRLKVTGDDSAHTWVDSFGGVRIQGWGSAFIAKCSDYFFNCKLTNCYKDGPPEDMQITQGEFLKRKFLVRDGIVSAALNKDSIIRMTQWVQKNDEHTPHIQFVINARTAIREAFYHGREFYEEFRGEMNRHLKRINCYSNVETKDYDAMASILGKLQH
jgi:hypothetical protein